MKRATPFLFIVAVLLAVLLVAIPAQGSGCRVVAVKQVVVKEQVAVVAAAIVTPVVAQFIPVPLYGATYNPYAYPVAPQAAPQYAPHAPQGAACADLAGTVKALSDELRSLKAQLSKPTTPHMPPAEGNPSQPTDPFAPQRQQQQGQAPQQQYSPEEMGAIIDSVSNLKMPKGDKLASVMPVAERLELVAALSGGNVEVSSRIMTARCASCHSESNAKAAGKGIVLIRAK